VTVQVPSPAPRKANFSYNLGGLTAGAPYTVRLHFAEIHWTDPGRRQFDVSINDTQVLDNYDICAAAGALKAVVRDSPPGQTATAGVQATGFAATGIRAIARSSISAGRRSGEAATYNRV
jgi:hypothetical protein